jgi:hypothetical protein
MIVLGLSYINMNNVKAPKRRSPYTNINNICTVCSWDGDLTIYHPNWDILRVKKCINNDYIETQVLIGLNLAN